MFSTKDSSRLFLVASLSVDPVLHEGDGPGVAPLVGGGSHGGRLHDDVVDDAPGHQEVGEQHHEQHLLSIGEKNCHCLLLKGFMILGEACL